MTDFKNLLTDDEVEAVKQLRELIPIVKNKWFSLGRDIDKFMKLCDKFSPKK